MITKIAKALGQSPKTLLRIAIDDDYQEIVEWLESECKQKDERIAYLGQSRDLWKSSAYAEIDKPWYRRIWG